ncbi:uncharacterized protein DEA37_0002204 [Paragonimus westermani]|uniref:Uncharacterized protein n=1 Tax=Paragonimus westermani TaxID=34504 RepID=A0A5J4P3A1_9TREM|nr:uncharacterized protein DEA37_0002204 [Paragonimus westermani]
MELTLKAPTFCSLNLSRLLFSVHRTLVDSLFTIHTMHSTQGSLLYQVHRASVSSNQLQSIGFVVCCILDDVSTTISIILVIHWIRVSVARSREPLVTDHIRTVTSELRL